MNPQDEIRLLETIIDEILLGVQELLTSGQRLSDELQGMIADELEITLQRIQQLRQENPPPAPAPLKMQRGMPSAQVHSFDYDPRNQNLYVRFQDKYPRQNGPVYRYNGVPRQIFELLRRGGVAPTTTGKNKWHAWKKGVTPSLGAVMNHVIKAGGYPYARLT